MSRAGSDPYSVAHKAAHDLADGVIQSIVYRLKEEGIPEDDIYDVIHEEVQNALIYTADQWVCAYGLKNEEDCFEEGLLCEPANFEEALGMQAYCNLRAYVADFDYSAALEGTES